MICPKCGAQVEDTALFCTNCGASLSTAGFEQPVQEAPQPEEYPVQPEQQATASDQNNSYQAPQPINYQIPGSQQYTDPRQYPNPQQPIYPGNDNGVYQQPQNYQQNYQPNYQQNYQQPYYNNAAALNNEPPMKWFKFLINFALFAGAVLNLITAIRYFAGSIYGENSAGIYSYFKGLKTVDIIYGVLCLGLVALALVARFSLSGFKKNGPTLLYTLYGANILFGVIYAIAVGIVCHDMSIAFSPGTIGGFIGSGVMLAVNIIYFNKRKHMFVN